LIDIKFRYTLVGFNYQMKTYKVSLEEFPLQVSDAASKLERRSTTYLVKVGGELWAPEIIKIEERADAGPCSTERESDPLC
jgi:hypothetical protein